MNSTLPYHTNSSSPHVAACPDKFRVLVVEDDPHIARLILANLAKVGMECRYAGDGDAALVSFREREPHLVVLDLTIPGINGFAVCTRIRQISKVPIIVVTARDEIETQLHSLKIGADDFVPKPFDTKILVARVIAQLRRAYRYDAPASDEESVPRSSLPPGWASCDACSYIGPGAVFQRPDVQGRPGMICPHCKSAASVAFSVS
ncbi:MAG: two-component system, OmpR family, response regulator BaeR [Abditibacteriota bacterium]|nr:two-component system, OmpR family, response regulator BaeR [Abditibacteriota bacterium]